MKNGTVTKEILPSGVVNVLEKNENNVAASKEPSMIGSHFSRLQKKRALNSYSNFPL
ncbi:uncharacterized protein Dsimw501_GD29535 [Drosophila simulans]|nr:uncharacterized protein Dsimw501_GD29535 [Drosophila simulans]